MVLLEKQGSTTTASYTYGSSLINRGTETMLFDGHGDLRTVTNSSQTVTATGNFDAYGNSVGGTGSSSTPYQFGAASGYRNDGDAGLLHIGARWYDPGIGRWISRDPDLTQPAYLYCGSNPVGELDPDGRNPGVVVVVVFVPGLGEIILITAGVAAGAYLIYLLAKEIGDAADRWRDDYARRKQHKEDGRDDRARRKDYDDRMKERDGDEKPPRKPKMKHKQGDARNY